MVYLVFLGTVLDFKYCCYMASLQAILLLFWSQAAAAYAQVAAAAYTQVAANWHIWPIVW